MNDNNGCMICRNVTKKYKEKQVLNNINLTLEPAKIYGLIGRNGAGKTTLLSVMSSQNPLTSGEVTYCGENIWENQKALDNICFSREINVTMGKNPNNFKVKQYLKVASIFYPHWDKAMAETLVNDFQIDVKAKISKLSKGMLSMVTIIIALASKAPFTFMDEPTSGLDIVAREDFYRLLLEEYTETGRTFVISTHIIEEASDVFEEVIIMNRGKVIIKENTQELIERAYHVSGKKEDVDAAVFGLEKHHEETTGRGKGVTVLLQKGQSIKQGYDVSVQSMSLQNIFVALCGNEEACG